MNPIGQQIRQERVNPTVPRHSCFPFKQSGNDGQVEMSFSFRPRAGMARMKMGFVCHLQPRWLKRFANDFLDLFCYSHPPS